MDETAHIIVAAELDNVAPDANWLLPMIQAVHDNLGRWSELGLADAGYRSEANFVTKSSRIYFEISQLMMYFINRAVVYEPKKCWA